MGFTGVSLGARCEDGSRGGRPQLRISPRGDGRRRRRRGTRPRSPRRSRLLVCSASAGSSASIPRRRTIPRCRAAPPPSRTRRPIPSSSRSQPSEVAAGRRRSASSCRRSAVQTRSPVSRSIRWPPIPSRVASQAFSTIRSSRCAGQRLAGVVAARELADEALHERDQRGRVVDPRLRIRDANLDRAVRPAQAEVPPLVGRVGERAAVAGPDGELGELLPAREGGRHAGPRPALVELRADGREARVLAAVERRVRAEREQLGEVAAERVVDGERAVGAAHRDVDVHAAREHVPGRPRVVGGDAPVALRRGDRAGVARERVSARADDEDVGPSPSATSRRIEASSRATSATDTHTGVMASTWQLRSSPVRRRSPAPSARAYSAAGVGCSVSASTRRSSSSAPTVKGATRSNRLAQALLERLRAEIRVGGGDGDRRRTVRNARKSADDAQLTSSVGARGTGCRCKSAVPTVGRRTEDRSSERQTGMRIA